MQKPGGSGSQSLQIFSGVRGRFHFQNQIVFDAMIAGIEIDDISDQHQQNHPEYDTKYFKNFLTVFFIVCLSLCKIQVKFLFL